MLSCCTFISFVATNAVDVDCSALIVKGEVFIDVGVVGVVVLVGAELNIS